MAAKLSKLPVSPEKVHAWTWFTDEMNRSYNTNHSVEDIKDLLPGTTAADVVWVQGHQRFLDKTIEDAHLAPEHVLLYAPDVKLSAKLLGDAGAMFHRPAVVLDFLEPDQEAHIWSRFDVALQDFESLRGKVPVTQLLWTKAAQDFDERMWRGTDLDAEDLLTLPDVALMRKYVADAFVSHISKCVGSVGAMCDMGLNFSLEMCNLFKAVCDRNPLLKAAVCTEELGICQCEARCGACVCKGGTPPTDGCLTDCSDGSHGCRVPAQPIASE